MQIDRIDAQMVALIAERMGVVEGVINVKREHRLPAMIPDRVEAVVAHVRAIAIEKGAPPGLVEELWRCMIAWTIAHEDAALSE
jgi:isochorismate pyruvate lyase